MNIYRIGSNWDGTNLLPIFKEEKIAFAGSEKASSIAQVKSGDIVAITAGQTIVAVGRVAGLKLLEEIKAEYADDFDHVQAIVFEDLYFASDYKDVSFGFYDGIGKQFHQAKNGYIKSIKGVYQEIIRSKREEKYVDLLLANKNLVLTGAPGTGKTYLAREIARKMVLSPLVTVDMDNSAFGEFQHSHLDLEQVLEIQSKWQYWRGRILSDNFNVDDYTGTLLHVNNPDVRYQGSYLMNFLEWTSKGTFGSSKPGNAEYFGIKMNSDGSYYVAQDESRSFTREEAEQIFQQTIAPWLKELVSAPMERQIQMVDTGIELIRARQPLRKIVVLEHPEKLLSIYQDVTISNAYKYFVKGSATSFMEKNLQLLTTLYRKFSLAESVENQLRVTRFIWSYFGSGVDKDIAEMKSEVVETFFREHSAFVQFHPSYDYTDFFDGLRPVKGVGEMEIGFELRNGAFKSLCMKAKTAWEEDKLKTDKRKFVFIIDEINRAEISKVFGELFFAIDPGYRGEKGTIKTQYANLQTLDTCFTNPDDDYFYVPENVFIIGTMNDIDRSVESFDFAMRRRFCWEEISARERMSMWDGQIDPWKQEASFRMISLNEAIDQTEDLGSSYHIGPAYFLKLKENEGSFQGLWKNNISVILKEYLRGIPGWQVQYEQLKSAYFGVDESEQL